MIFVVDMSPICLTKVDVAEVSLFGVGEDVLFIVLVEVLVRGRLVMLIVVVVDDGDGNWEILSVGLFILLAEN